MNDQTPETPQQPEVTKLIRKCPVCGKEMDLFQMRPYFVKDDGTSVYECPGNSEKCDGVVELTQAEHMNILFGQYPQGSFPGVEKLQEMADFFKKAYGFEDMNRQREERIDINKMSLIISAMEQGWKIRGVMENCACNDPECEAQNIVIEMNHPIDFKDRTDEEDEKSSRVNLVMRFRIDDPHFALVKIN